MASIHPESPLVTHSVETLLDGSSSYFDMDTIFK